MFIYTETRPKARYWFPFNNPNQKMPSLAKNQPYFRCSDLFMGCFFTVFLSQTTHFRRVSRFAVCAAGLNSAKTMFNTSFPLRVKIGMANDALNLPGKNDIPLKWMDRDWTFMSNPCSPIFFVVLFSFYSNLSNFKQSWNLKYDGGVCSLEAAMAICLS